MPSSSFKIESLPDLKGRVYLVTGGNAGIGKATVVGLATRGARVYVGARTESKANQAIQAIRAELPHADVQFLHIDLSNLESVVSAAKLLRERETKLHGLINNAGVMGVPFSMTQNGYEIQFQTNYLSHWLLTYHLMPLLQATAEVSPPGTVRIIDVSSDGHESFPPKGGINFENTALEKENAMTRYGQSKLGNVLHTQQLDLKSGPPSGGKILTAAVHPGHIDTDLNKQATGSAPSFILRMATPVMRCVGILDEQAKGAHSSLFAVASESFTAKDSGSYVVPYAKIGTPSEYARDVKLGERLWDWTLREMQSKGFIREP